MKRPTSIPSVLIVEDEYPIALAIKSTLSDAGYRIVGPVGTIPAAIALISTTENLNAAVLDPNLRGEIASEVAQSLTDRDIPFVLVSGYSRHELGSWASNAELIEKPILDDRLLDCLDRLIPRRQGAV
ncbi:MAG: response regulator [Alphaproteobacteria bacterium]|nr:response regulator [Alphaproteobacteria bacterium]